MHLESLARHGNVSGTGLAVQVGECLVYLEYCTCVQCHVESINSAAMVDNLLDGEQSALSKTIN